MRPLGRTFYYLIGTSVVVMLIAGAMLVVPALAGEGQASGSELSSSGQTREQNAQANYEDFITKLAANLGISDPATVDSGIKSALSQMIDQRQQDGKLSQAHAESLKNRINSEEFPRAFPGIMGYHHGHWSMGKRLHNLDQIAGFLGISASDLKSELQQGNSLAAVAENHGKTRDDLKAFLADLVNTRANGRADPTSARR